MDTPNNLTAEELYNAVLDNTPVAYVRAVKRKNKS